MSTKKENTKEVIKQVASIEDTETIIRIDYSGKKIYIYTNKATVIKRMDKLEYKAVEVDKCDGKILSKTYCLPTRHIGKFLKTSIFKYD